MKFLSKFMVLFLLSSCSYFDNTPEDYTMYTFPSTWQGYYKSEPTSNTLNYLTEEFKVSKDYITLKNFDSSSSTGSYDDEKFTSYQIDYIYSKSTDSFFCFTVYPAYESQEFIEGYFLFEPSNDKVKVTYYYDTYGNKNESATYEKK